MATARRLRRERAGAAAGCDVRLMNAVAAVCLAALGVVAAGRGAGVAGRARRCSRSAPSGSRATCTRNSVVDHPRQRRAAARRQLLHHRPATGRAPRFEAVPWVRRAVVRPGLARTACAVRLEEHRAVALWEPATARHATGSSTTTARSSRPTSATSRTTRCRRWPAPRGSAGTMLAHVQHASRRCSRRCDARHRALRLSGRGSWRAELDNGAQARDRPRQRRRAGRAHPALRAHAGAGHWRATSAPLSHADLRHTDGYARAAARRHHHADAAGKSARKQKKEPGRAHGKGIQGSGRRLDIGTAKVMAVVAEVLPRRRAARRRAGRRAGARPEARRGRQHRRHGAEHPAGAERGRDDGRLQDHARLYRHHRQPHPRPELHRHGDRARQRK